MAALAAGADELQPLAGGRQSSSSAAGVVQRVALDTDSASESLVRGSNPQCGRRRHLALGAAAACASAGLLAREVSESASSRYRADPPTRYSQLSAEEQPWLVGIGCSNWQEICIEELTHQSRSSCSGACRANGICRSCGFSESSEGLGDCMLFADFCQEQDDPRWDTAYDLRSTLAPEVSVDTGCSNWEEMVIDISSTKSAVLCEERCYRYPLGCGYFGFHAAEAHCFLFQGRCEEQPSPGWDLYMPRVGKSAAVPADAKDDAVELEWFNYGRLGNQVAQVASALLFAQGTGRRFLCFPDDNSEADMRGMFWLPFRPACMPVLPKLDTSRSLHCITSNDSLRIGNFFEQVFRCNYSLTDSRRVLQQHLLPLRSPSLQIDCMGAASSMSVFDGLTVHLRSGDLLHETKHCQSPFAPCAFFDSVIQRVGFKEVLIVTEPDRKHPCIRHLMDRADINVTVQSESIRYDSCTLANAKHLAVGSVSTFSICFGLLMNKALRTFYYPFESFGSNLDTFGTGEPCESSRQSRIQLHKVDGLQQGATHLDSADQAASAAEKLEYIGTTSTDAVTFVGEVCFE